MGFGLWLQERLGWKDLDEAFRRELQRPVPSHVNVLYTLGFVALSLFAVQAATGVLLAMNYTPSMEGGWESVQKITHEAPFGWLVRGIHHWAANILVGVLLAHTAVAIWYGAYKKPREVTWVAGCFLLFLTLSLCLTGYLLPMEQLSYWATTVVTDILRDLPIVENRLARIVRGGDDISDATLSRFMVLHIWALPLGAAALVGLHLFLVHKLGITPKARVGEEGPDPAAVPFGKYLAKDILAMTAALSAVLALAVLLPRQVEAKFDRQATPAGVRPEWYFVWAQQLLKALPKLPGLAVLNLIPVLLVALPWIDRSKERDWRGRKRILLFFLLVATGITILSVLGFWESESARRGAAP